MVARLVDEAEDVAAQLGQHVDREVLVLEPDAAQSVVGPAVVDAAGHVSSSRQEAAVDDERLAAHERGIVGGQEDDGPRDLARLGDPAERYSALDLRAQRGGVGGGVEIGLHERRVDVAGADRVAADPVGAVLHRRRARDPEHAALGGAVGGEDAVADEREDRRDVDDRAAARRPHRPHGVLAAEEDALEVHGRARGRAAPRVVSTSSCSTWMAALLTITSSRPYSSTAPSTSAATSASRRDVGVTVAADRGHRLLAGRRRSMSQPTTSRPLRCELTGDRPAEARGDAGDDADTPVQAPHQ